MYGLNVVLFLCVIVEHNTCISASPLCGYRDLCDYNEARPFPSCYCDKQCVHYNDCCKEVFTAHASVNNSRPDLIDQNCIILTSQKNISQQRIGAYMITKCQNSGTPCQTKGYLEGLLPVSKDEVTFLNAECAICNHIEKFVSWRALFHVPDIQSILSVDNESLGYIRNEYVLEYLSNERSSSESSVYFLQPPTAFRPRYCPFEFINSTYPGMDEYIHQNIVRCEDRFFKNNEKCLEDGCCMTSPTVCYALHLFQGNGQDRHNNLNVIVSTSFEKNEAQFKEKHEPDQSTISYFLALEYGLSKMQTYYYMWVQDVWCRFEVNFRSGLKLTASEANNLLQLDSVIHCHNKSTKQNTLIIIKGSQWMGYYHFDKHEDVKYRMIRSAKFKPSSTTGMKLCYNASLVLNTVEAGIVFHIECPDNDDPSVRNKARRKTEGSMSHYLFLNLVILSIWNFFIF